MILLAIPNLQRLPDSLPIQKIIPQLPAQFPPNQTPLPDLLRLFPRNTDDTIFVRANDIAELDDDTGAFERADGELWAWLEEERDAHGGGTRIEPLSQGRFSSGEDREWVNVVVGEAERATLTIGDDTFDITKGGSDA